MDLYIDIKGDRVLASLLVRILTRRFLKRCFFGYNGYGSFQGLRIGTIYCVSEELSMDAINKNLEILEQNSPGIPITLIIVDKNGLNRDWEHHPERLLRVLRVNDLITHTDKICNDVEDLVQSFTTEKDDCSTVNPPMEEVD